MVSKLRVLSLMAVTVFSINACASTLIVPTVAAASDAASTETAEAAIATLPATQRTEVIARWEALRYGMFICYGLGTFVEEQYGETLDAPNSAYNPTDLDVDQWIRVAKDAGMKYAVLVTRHCSGHCLWPSKFTDRTVANSGETSDVVQLYVDACRRHGVAPGLYYMLGWDTYHQNRMGYDEYEAFLKNQLTELLTNYGPIVELWLDSPKCVGPGGQARLQRIYTHCKKLQPDCLVLLNQGSCTGEFPTVANEQWLGWLAYGKQFEGSVMGWPVDIINSEAAYPTASGHVPWLTVNNKKHYIPMEFCETILACAGDEALAPPQGSWFYLEDARIRSAAFLKKQYDTVTGRGANLLLNVPPDKTGRIPENQVELLMQLKKAIDADASYKSLASGRPSFASSVWEDDHKKFGPQRAFDNNSNTRWTSSGTDKAWLEVDLGEQRQIGQIGLSECGGHVQSFELQYSNGSGWKTFIKGKEIGYKWREELPTPIKARKFRLLITKTKNGLAIWEFRLFEATHPKP